MWNVNTVCLDELTEEQIELIETLWNVNTYEPPAAGSTDKELIETLWNVNEDGQLREFMTA